MAVFDKPAEQIAVVVRCPGCSALGYHPWPNDYNPGPPSWDNLGLYAGGTGADWFKGRIGHDVHNDGSNYAFMDGHAKWYRWEATVQPQLPGMHNIERIIPGWHHG